MNISADGLLLRTLGTIAGLIVCYVVAGAIYRLFFSPVAKFPGPTLTALTLWYEFYYDVIKGGKFKWQIKRMHENYGTMLPSLTAVPMGQANDSVGPIVRINP